MSVRVHVDPGIQPIVHDGIRWYVIDGVPYPSVTSILSATRVDGEGLVRWKSEATPQQLADVERWRDEGAERGHALHRMCEAKLLHGRDGSGTWWQSIAPVLERVTAVHGLELPLVHPDLKYAGRCDLWASYGDARWEYDSIVVDWKSARKPKRRKWCDEFLAQVAAYAAASPLCYPDHVAPDHGLVVILGEEHDLRCDACGWAATLTHDSECVHCQMPCATVEVRGRKADEFVFGPAEIRRAFDKFCTRVDQFWRTHSAPDLDPNRCATAAE